MPRMVSSEAYHQIVRIVVNAIFSPAHVMSIYGIKVVSNNPQTESSIPIID